ncbi:MAG: site-2 protease family protein [Deltaproteobacteria bacterium]|nr:site-2 protease family protein [Deltaproteobacteria bacterium]
MDVADILQKAVLVLVPMVLSLTVHEYAHARVAFALGDDTAASMGRMNLNPMSHIDPFGTILLPLMAVVFNSPVFFGWAKPVPVNPVQFTRKIRMKTGMLLTAAAGPTANIALAFIIGILFSVLRSTGLDASLGQSMISLLSQTFLINVVLAIFNLIPVPPLDGSRVLVGLLPDSLGRQFAYLERNPMFVILAFAILITQAGSILQFPVAVVARTILFMTGNAS